MNSYSNISDEEIIFLIKISSKQAKNELISRYDREVKKLVFTILKDYPNTGIPVDDLISVGMYSLTKAIKNYNNTGKLNVTFKTYWATICEHDLMEHIKKFSYRGLNVSRSSVSFDEEIISGDRRSGRYENVLGEIDDDLSAKSLFDDFVNLITNDDKILSDNEKKIMLDYLYGIKPATISNKYKITRQKYYRIIQKGKAIITKFYAKISE